MRLFITGGSGVLGRAVIPLLIARGYSLVTPSHIALDLSDRDAVSDALRGCEAVLHLATRIPPADRRNDPSAWSENDRLRADVTRIIVEAALAGGVTRTIVVPTVTFVYPPGPADELTPIGEVAPFLLSALTAERQVTSFGSLPGRRGVVLRLGSLHGPGTGAPIPDWRFDSHLHVAAAGRALADALEFPTGVYNVVDPGGPVSGARYDKLRQALHPSQ